MAQNESDKLHIPRRTLLKGAGALALSPLLMSLEGKSSFAAASNIKKGSRAQKFNTKLVLLGTTGGMTWWPGSNRASSSQALVVGDSMYIIDLGFGATQRLAEAFNHAKFVTINGEKLQLELSTFLKNVRAVFLTHLHMDHLGDYPTFLMIGARAGFGIPNRLQIIGPGDRGRLEENKTGYSGTILKAECGGAKQTTTPGTKQRRNRLL